MSYQRTEIPESDIQHQLDICAQLRAHFTAGGRQPLAMVDTYGCQQNEADSEHIMGMLREMGFAFTEDVLIRPMWSSSTPAPCGSTPSSGSIGNRRRSDPYQNAPIPGR